MKMIGIIFLLILCLPNVGMGCDVFTDNQLAMISAQSGVSITFLGSTSVDVNFTSLAWGDPDGYASSTPGYLILEALGSFDISIVLSDTMTVDVSDSALIIGLPTIDIFVDMPPETEIALAEDAEGTNKKIFGTLSIGQINVDVFTPSGISIAPH
ncbi:MAG: hypothetical protein HQK77_17305 [Desulfobacterales bacterium]|nr:hypothetical protein [Desulfobacterales bacterium]